MNLSPLIPYFDTIFVTLLVLFTLASTVLGGMTILNAIRLRNVQLTWKSGTLKGYPLFSSAFLIFTVLVIFANWYLDNTHEYLKLTSYSIIGINWFLVSFLTSKRYITDNGIVKNINDPSQTIAWHQVTDFVEREMDSALRYTFFYMEDDQKPTTECCRHCVRLELDVPKKKGEQFKKILFYKLGRRFNCYFTKESGIEEFK